GGRHGVFRGMGDDPPLSESGDVHGREEVAGGDVRIFHDFGEALDRGDRKSLGFEEALPLRQRLLAEPGGEGLATAARSGSSANWRSDRSGAPTSSHMRTQNFGSTA